MLTITSMSSESPEYTNALGGVIAAIYTRLDRAMYFDGTPRPYLSLSCSSLSSSALQHSFPHAVRTCLKIEDLDPGGFSFSSLRVLEHFVSPSLLPEPRPQ